MTGRERVRAALTFSKPDRPPRDLWALPGVVHGRKGEYEDFLRAFPMDIANAIALYPPSERGIPPFPQPGAYTDIWGSIWHVAEPGVVGEVKQPILADWSRLAAFQPPWRRVRQRDLSGVNRMCEHDDRFVLSEWTANPFERLQFLCGPENFYRELGYATLDLRKLLTIVHEYFLEDIRSWGTSGVDGIVFSDNWGSNHSLLIHPTTWREVFKPLYRQYCDLIHAAGKFVFFHSDGCIETIYGDLIEIGVDAINSQLFVMDIEELGRKYQGKVTFWGEMDRQHVLPFGSPEEVHSAVLRVRRALDDGTGGVIAQCEWGIIDPRPNIEAVYRAWL
jgi:hypothetical protein